MRKKPLHSLLALLLLLTACYAEAQLPFAYRTPVRPVEETKFYAILLTPEVLASCKTADLTDLRLADSAGGIVPYLLKVSSPGSTAGRLVPYPVISNIHKDSSSEVVIRNASGGAINTLSLVIKNASAYRTGVLSGSDDTLHWYVIDEQVRIDPVSSASRDQFIQTLRFPLSNYRFIKLTLFDRGLLPLNILQAGASKEGVIASSYTLLPAATLSQKDSSDHVSYISIRFPNPFKIDKLKIIISRPSLYRRSFSLQVEKPVFQTDVAEGELRPGMDTVLLNVKAQELQLRVNNGDNPPLQIARVFAFQAERQLVAQLEKGRQYFVLTGNEQAGAVSYDLQFFRDSLLANTSQTGVGQVQKNPAPLAPSPPANRYGKFVMWGVIIIVLLVLSWLTVRMSKEVGRKDPVE